MFGRKKPTIMVGLESTLDTWITLPTLEEFSQLAKRHKGSMSKYLKDAHKLLKAGKGDEVAIDGKTSEAQKILALAKGLGAEVQCTLGGNAALEATAFKALGADVVFAGGIFPKQINELPGDSRKYFGAVDFSFATAFEDYFPSSYIMQAKGSNRYILCEGQGRRIEQLRPDLEKLPETVEKVVDKYGKLDMINLVGWQVLFANGLSDKDLKLVKATVNKIREKVSTPLLTDAGGLASFSVKDRKRLFQVYSLFDVLSINEDELLQISKAIDVDTEDEFQIMNQVLESSEKLSTIWMHSLDFQASLSKKYSKERLEKAQMTSAAAGVFRVENGTFGTMSELEKRMKTKNYSEKGVEKAKYFVSEHSGKVKGREIAATPCFVARSFTSTVGAGDISTAAFTSVISKV